MEPHHFSSQIHDLESCPLREENRQLKLELEAIKDLAQKTEGERQQYCADLMAADEHIEELEAKIKELELALSNSREYGRQLCKRFNDYRQRINELEETKSKMYDSNQLMNANIKELEATISKLETAAPKWISLKDRLPYSMERVLVCTTRGTFAPATYSPLTNSWIEHGQLLGKVTHWMPLPSSPTTEEK